MIVVLIEYQSFDFHSVWQVKFRVLCPWGFVSQHMTPVYKNEHRNQSDINSCEVCFISHPGSKVMSFLILNVIMVMGMWDHCVAHAGPTVAHCNFTAMKRGNCGIGFIMSVHEQHLNWPVKLNFLLFFFFLEWYGHSVNRIYLQCCRLFPLVFCHMRPVLTKWATSRQGTKGEMAHWTFQKSIENKRISQGKNSIWTLNKAATVTCNMSF